MMITSMILGLLACPPSKRIGKLRSRVFLKAKLKRRDLSYVDLAEKLAGIGVRDNQRNIPTRSRAGPSPQSFSFNVWKPSG